MKKTIAFLILAAALTVCLPIQPALAGEDAPANSAVSSILYDAVGETVLHEKNADEKRLIASTTKIITALVALERKALDDAVLIKPEYTNVEGSSIYLTAGETVTLRELIYGLLLNSGNDAATAIAFYTAGSIEKFAAMMNEKARSLGCNSTSFENPHGLDGEKHYSTARDLAVIMADAMKNAAFREITSTQSVRIGGRTFTNHNRLLWEHEAVIGGKTGYTIAAGRTLVTCAEREGMTLICVTLSDRNDWDDHTALYDWAFDKFQCVRINMSDTKFVSLPVISGTRDMVSVRPSRDYIYICPKTDELTAEMYAPSFVYAAVVRGAKAGQIVVKRNGEQIDEIPLVYAENVSIDDSIRLTAWEKIKWAWFFANSRGGPGFGTYMFF